MKPGPNRFWHSARRRSSFWLGLFVACFLAWAWWDSFRSQSTAVSEWRNRTFTLSSLDGTIYFVSGSGWLTSHAWGFRAWSGKKVANYEQTLTNVGASHRRVPHSLVFFSFLGHWVGWLAWGERLAGNAAPLG
jgi:hypothetical protein